MQGTLNQTKSSSDSIMPFSKDSSNNDQDSGLHDLQAMASSAKRRRSQRLSTQMEAQDSLLRSTAALDAVVLPDPTKEQAPVSIAAVTPASADKTNASAGSASASGLSTAATSSSATAVPDLDASPSKSSGKGLYVGLAIAAAAAAAAFFVLGEKGENKSSDSASKPVAAIVPAAPMQADPVPADAGSDEVAPTEVAIAAVAATAVVADPTEATLTEPAALAEPELAVKASKTEKTNRPKAETKSKPKASSKEKTSEPKPKSVAVKATKTPKPRTTSANASLDDVLSTVTGGVDKPIAKTSESAAPSKKTLGRGDVSKAMKKISPAAKSCYKTEEFSGMVKIKYSVGSDGKVTKASATGAHSGSKTGACVVNAVKKAKFPPFSGATMSFTFPFLLSP